MKKSIAMLLALLMAFPMIMPGIIPAYASGDITITDVSHSVSEGTASYSVTLESSYDGASPAVAIVHYEDNVLTTLDVEKCTLSSATPTLVTVSVPVSVTDSTRVTGFVMDSMSSAIPLRSDEIERFGSTVNSIATVEVDGISSGDVVVDSSEQTVSVYLPFYDSDGNEADFSAAQMTVTLDHDKAQASLVDAGVQFTGDGAVKTAVVDLGYIDTLRIISEEGSARDYELKIFKTFTEDFESATTILQQNTTKYEGKGDTASKLLVATSQTNAAVGFGSGNGSSGGFYIEKTLQSASNPTFKITPDAALNSDYHSIEYDLKFEYVGGDKPTTYLAGYEAQIDGAWKLRLLGGDISATAYEGGTKPSFNIFINTGGSTSAAITNMDSWHRIKLDYTVQSDGTILPRLWDGTTEITQVDRYGTTHYIKDKYFGTALPQTHVFLIQGARTIRVCIDNIKFTQSVCNKRSVTPVTPPPATGAESLDFTPEISSTGEITVNGYGKLGSVMVAVTKVSSADSEVDLDTLSDEAYVVLDATVVGADGSFALTGQLPNVDDAGYYAFVVGNTGVQTSVADRTQIIYYASPTTVSQKLNEINDATDVSIASILETNKLELQLSSFLDNPVYKAHTSAIAKDLVAQRKSGFETPEHLREAISLAIGAQAVANADEATLDSALGTYGETFALSTEDYESNKPAVLRCYATVKNEYYSEKLPSSADVADYFDTVLALAKVNTAARGDIMEIIEDNDSVLGISTTGLNKNEKNTVAKKIVVTDVSKEYKTVGELVKAFDRAVDSLDSGNSGGGGGGFGGSSSSGSSPIISTGETKKEIQISEEATQKAPVFTDLHLASWAEEYITCLAENGIVNGKTDGIFDPNSSVTREEFAKMLTIAVKAEGKSDISFTDVSPDAWYTPYIGAAVEAGIVTGYEDGTFGIGKNISRQEAAVMIYRAASLIHSEFPRGSHGFSDSESIASWADEAVGNCVALGIISGNNMNEFLPTNNITRAECAKMIYCLIRTE